VTPVFLILAIACFSGAALIDSRPDLELSARPSSLDLGAVASDSDHTCQLRLKNSGRLVAEIVKTRSSCGCTVANAQTTRLAPGEETTLSVQISSGHHPGPLFRMVFVEIANRDRGLAGMVSIPIHLSVNK